MKLLQKFKVVFKKQAQVINAVTQHGQSFHTHAESESAVNFVVDIDRFEHFGMDHAATHNFQPARLAANPAARAIAHDAFDIDFR